MNPLNVPPATNPYYVFELEESERVTYAGYKSGHEEHFFFHETDNISGLMQAVVSHYRTPKSEPLARDGLLRLLFGDDAIMVEPAPPFSLSFVYRPPFDGWVTASASKSARNMGERDQKEFMRGIQKLLAEANFK